MNALIGRRPQPLGDCALSRLLEPPCLHECLAGLFLGDDETADYTGCCVSVFVAFSLSRRKEYHDAHMDMSDTHPDVNEIKRDTRCADTRPSRHPHSARSRMSSIRSVVFRRCASRSDPSRASNSVKTAIQIFLSI
jgi:hypothetical protein